MSRTFKGTDKQTVKQERRQDAKTRRIRRDISRAQGR